MTSTKNAIVAKFGLDLTPLKQASRRAIDIVRKMSMAIKAQFATLAKFVAPLAVAMGLVFSTASVKGIFDLVDGMDELSRKTGVGIQALLEMRSVFDDNGASVSMLGMATMSLNRAFSSKKGVEMFGKLGLNINHLKRLSPEKMFHEIGKKIGAIQNPMDRIAASTALFGRMGKELIPVFSDPAFAALGTKTDKQAQVMAANAEALGAASDSFNHLLKVGRGFFVGIAVKLAPLWNAMADKLSAIDFVDAGLAFGQVLAKTATFFAGWLSLLKSAGMAMYKAIADGGVSIASIIKGVTGVLYEMKPILELAGYSLYLILLEAGQVIGKLLADAGRYVGEAFKYVADLVLDIIDQLSAYFSSDFSSSIMAVLQSVWDTFVEVGTWFGKALFAIAVTLKDMLLGIAAKFVVSIYEGMKSAAAMFVAIVSKAIDKIVLGLSKIPGLGHLAKEVDNKSVGEKYTEARSRISSGLGGVETTMKGLSAFGDESFAKARETLTGLGQAISDKVSPIFEAVKGALASAATATKDRLKSFRDAAIKVWESMDAGKWADPEIARAKAKIKEAFDKIVKAGEKILTPGKDAPKKDGDDDPTRGGFIGANSIWSRGVKRGVGFARKRGETKEAYEQRKADTISGIRSRGKTKSKDPADRTNELLEKINNTMEEAWQ